MGLLLVLEDQLHLVIGHIKRLFKLGEVSFGIRFLILRFVVAIILVKMSEQRE